jgi:hypothetical protein
MQVNTSHHVDAGKQNAEGLYDYYYEYDILVFSDGDLSMIARSYMDTPLEAHFLKVELNAEQRQLTDTDLNCKLFAESVAYLLAHGKTEINWLSGRGNGYEPVPA